MGVTQTRRFTFGYPHLPKRLLGVYLKGMMTLIKGSTVIDGTGEPGRKADVLIKDDKIVGIGSFPSQKIDVVLDGLGLTTTPGFIDVNTDSDHYLSLFTDPAQQDFLLQGVTTIIGGHCGSSLAPLIKGSLESIRKWADTNLINVNWNTMKEFLTTLEKLRLGVNFGTLVGHSTIRRSLLGEQQRDLTAAELQQLSFVATQALEEGALGISTGLGYNHSKGTPYDEVKMLAALAAKYRGVYATHLRHEHEQLAEAVAETVKVAAETGAKTLISHFRAIEGFDEQFDKALQLIEQAGGSIHFDSYPFDYSIVPIYTLLPEWARTGSLETMQQLIADESKQEALLKDFTRVRGDRIVIARAPGLDYLVGRTIAEYAANQEMPVTKGLLSLMRLTKLKAVVFRKNINLERTLKALVLDQALVASNSPSLLEGRTVIENERAAKTFSKFLDMVNTPPKKSLEWAVKKITSTPAQLFNLTGRGVLKEGMIADIAVLNGSRAVHVLVGGTLAVRDGAFQGGLNGRILRRG